MSDSGVNAHFFINSFVFICWKKKMNAKKKKHCRQCEMSSLRWGWVGSQSHSLSVVMWAKSGFISTTLCVGRFVHIVVISSYIVFVFERKDLSNALLVQEIAKQKNKRQNNILLLKTFELQVVFEFKVLWFESSMDLEWN